jgi:hypothetical protein
MNPSRIAFALSIVVVALLPIGVQGYFFAHTDVLFDFGVFYCAGHVVAHGFNPYLTEPLRSCEHAVIPGLVNAGNGALSQLVAPAPLPGYAIAAFVPLSFLPFKIAAALWLTLLLGAWCASIWAIVRFAGAAWQTVVAASALAIGATSIPLGQIVPVAIAAICLTAFFAWQGRWRHAAIAGAAAMLEPHLGLPVCLALALWAPRTRVPLAVAFVFLAALSLLVLGPSANLEYFTNVLPAHALSEVARESQYSLTPILVAAGIADTLAVRIGSLWYVVMLVCGVVFAGSIARKTGNTAFLACIPPAFAVFGGAFVHVTEIAAAIPAAILALGYAKGVSRPVAIVALLLLAVPWRIVVSPAGLLVPLFPIGYLAWCCWRGNLRAALLAVLAATLLFISIDNAYVFAARHHSVAFTGSKIDTRLAESEWSEFSKRSWSASIASWIVRVPTWCGLGLLLFVYAAAAARTRAESVPNRDSFATVPPQTA